MSGHGPVRRARDRMTIRRITEREGLAPMQWPDATASAATAGAGLVAGAAGDGRPVASPAAPVPRQQREHTGSQIAASGVPGGMDLPCTDDPDLFFAEAPEDVERAKAICRGCRARIACLTGALERREPWGVWGV